MLKAIQFGTLGTEDVKRISVAHIVTHDVFEKGIPKHGGLSDLRLGTIDRQFYCQTCKQDALGCSGHFGHIELVHPVYHVSFVRSIAKLLQSICVECSTPLAPIHTDTKLKMSKRFRHACDSCKSQTTCPSCEALQPKIACEKGEITCDGAAMDPQKVLVVLTAMSQETCSAFGFTEHSHPKNGILEVLLVPPPHVRPSVSMDAALKSQDDLTHKLSEIIKANAALAKGDSQVARELLQYHVTTYIDNGLPGIAQATQRSGRPIKAICQRLKSKEGRVRGNLMGKRVNFSARTVITAEPSIDLDELGIPWVIAKTLTYPETVTKFNIAHLQTYVNNGADPPFGKVGVRLVHQGGIQKDVRFVTGLRLSIGDVVDRHLKDGDVVVFNRQPSLHKMSMMGHTVRVMHHNTFRMNVCATTPYNADYDGDEMNIHAPQSEAARAEIKDLMMISKCMVSPQANKPVIGIIQDALLGCHKITSRDVFITKEHFCDIAFRLGCNTLPRPAMIKPIVLFTGKQLLSMVFPEKFDFVRSGALHTNEDIHLINDGLVTIKNGYILTGQLCKRSLGTSEGGIVHLLWLEYGANVACKFVSNVQYVVNTWLERHGFSIGAPDIFIDADTEVNVRGAISAAKQNVKQMLAVATDSSQFENNINKVLNNAMSQAGVHVQNGLDANNNINTAVTGGSKGSMFNIAQIMGCVGQQNVNGKRLSLGYTDRVLPHFAKGDFGPEARGFVENSYKDGLKPHEFLFHAMGGREGIVDTAIKTAETGYIQRRLIKAMEDLKVDVNKTVRNSIGDVVQFVYGSDGFDATFLSKHTLQYANDEQFQRRFVHQDAPPDEITELEHIMHTLDGNPQIIHSPLLLDRIHIPHSSSPACPSHIYENMTKLCNSWTLYSGCNHIFDTAALSLIIASVRLSLCTKRLRNVSTVQLDAILNTVDKRFQRAQVQSGEMVGTVAAQSLGEPCTQLTLNTFHAAGISAKNVTLGVPRFKELINVSKKIKSPSMTIAPRAALHDDQHLLKLASSLEAFSINLVCTRSEICDIAACEYMNIPGCSRDETYFSKCIRYFCDATKLKDHHLSLVDITVRVMQEYETVVCIAHTDFIDVLVYDDEDLSLDSLKLLDNSLQCDTIGGLTNLQRVYVNTDKNLLETDGSCLESVICRSDVDPYNTASNDVIEMCSVLGIEAARSLLVQELRHVIEFDGTYVNSRHFELLADTVTHKGGLMSITRHGINRSENGPLMKCSFEETVDVLTDAAMFSEKDLLRSVTENITVGKMAAVGTGVNDLYYQADIHSDSESDDDSELQCTNKRSYKPLSICSDFEYVST